MVKILTNTGDIKGFLKNPKSDFNTGSDCDREMRFSQKVFIYTHL
jgi:hypothetical protein